MSKDYLEMTPDDIQSSEDYARADFALRKQAHDEYMKTLQVQQEASKEQMKAMKKLVKAFAEMFEEMPKQYK